MCAQRFIHALAPSHTAIYLADVCSDAGLDGLSCQLGVLPSCLGAVSLGRSLGICLGLLAAGLAYFL